MQEIAQFKPRIWQILPQYPNIPIPLTYPRVCGVLISVSLRLRQRRHHSFESTPDSIRRFFPYEDRYLRFYRRSQHFPCPFAQYSVMGNSPIKSSLKTT